MLNLLFFAISLILFVFVVALPLFALIFGFTSVLFEYKGTDLEGASEINPRH